MAGAFDQTARTLVTNHLSQTLQKWEFCPLGPTFFYISSILLGEKKYTKKNWKISSDHGLHEWCVAPFSYYYYYYYYYYKAFIASK